MGTPSKYRVSSQAAGMNGQVLKNKLNIISEKDLGDAETLFLRQASRFLGEQVKIGALTFDIELLFTIHRLFLAPVYSWAGQIRTVNISKGDTMFCSAKFIPSALKDFSLVLEQNTPKPTDTKSQIAVKLAAIHCELNAIHPFREGNGRTIRLFLDLFAIQAGYNPILWNKRSHDEYTQACINGMNQDYLKMSTLIKLGLTKSRRA